MKRTVLAGSLLLAACPNLAHAVDVYPGCTVPTLKAGHHTFYVDPVKGTNDGDGSATKPWKDLNSVIGVYNKLLNTQSWSNAKSSYSPVNPNGPVKAGDVIMLMSGNYGPQKVLNAFNTDFVWLMAAPGQNPVMSQIKFVSSARWVVQGIKFLGGSPTIVSDLSKKPFDAAASIGAGDYTGTTNNIVFTSDTFATSDNTNSWSNLDWVLKPYYSSFQALGMCTSLTNSRFYNVFNGVLMGKNHSLMEGNSISLFSNDGVDVTDGNITIRSNSFTNGTNNPADGLHPDAIQGWSNMTGKIYDTNSNVLIEKNVIVKYGDWHITYLQGISIFDGRWDNLTIQNNSIVSNTSHAISVYGATNSRILNNSIVTSNDAQPSLLVMPAKDGTPASNVVVRNNIAPILALASKGVIYDHNIYTIKMIGFQNGVATTFVKGGQPSTQSLYVPNVGSMFVEDDTGANSYDLRLKPGSPANGVGSAVAAPATDILGTTRKAPIDIGAYQD